jgi:hypothetical protein
LTVIKKRRASTNKIRKAIRKQLGYLRRNLRHIEQLAAGVGLKSLSRQQYRNLLVTSEVFRQQALMYEAKHHRMSGRIVSISQPHIRPIVRGKAGTPVEFGMKISSANIDGYLFIDRCSWDPYNESGDLVMQAKSTSRDMACIQNQYTLIRFTEPGTTGPGARNGESDCLVRRWAVRLKIQLIIGSGRSLLARMSWIESPLKGHSAEQSDDTRWVD